MDLEAKKKTVELGDEVKDKISGFKGICTGIFNYLNGCVRAMIEPRTTKEGKPIEAHTFDVSQVEVLKKNVVPAYKADTGPGGPRKDPPARRAPKSNGR